MFKYYEYKYINGEKTLILYLDYNYEFGIDLKSYHKNSNMKNEIINFIKKNKIGFDYSKIAISIGGIILATFLVTNNQTISDEVLFTYVDDNIIFNQVEVITPPNSNQENIDNIIDDVVDNDVFLDKDEIVSNNNSVVNKPHNNSNSNSNNNNSNISNNGNINNETNDKIEEDSITKEELITVYRSNGEVIKLSFTDYLIGVVGAEMPASFSIEALKAQAIISRTYALKKIEAGIKLTDNVSTQSYKDNNELKAMWGSSYDTYYNKIKSAVLGTKDLAIYYKGNLIDAVYHSTSNGKTEDSVNVWGNNIPYLKSVDSSWDKDANSYLRVVSKDLENVLNLLGLNMNDITFSIISRNESGRVEEIKFGDNIYTGVEFRNLLGLRSSDFDIDLDNNSLVITTRGYGHGVGLSQYGANGMAKNGYNYMQILKHYYTGINVY